MPAVKSKPALAAILLSFLFCAISLQMVASGRGIPAVFDGNETFSSILHAGNLLRFAPQASAGLADESTSSHAPAHPVVHTHQGNFPRLYATILYAAGLTSPISQVVATTLPVGVASVLLLFAALRRFVGLAVAAISVAILLTDYIFFVQWQVVTYRVWQFAFTAALLSILAFFRSSGNRWLLIALFATSLCLFYYELVFATFLASSIAMLAIVLWRRTLVKGIAFVSIQFAGAVSGAAILMTQLVVYLGWQGFLNDLHLTYVSRNMGIALPETLAALRRFVEQHNIAFFYNFGETNSQASRLVLDSVFRWGLQAYTPPYAYCILILACGVYVALFARAGRLRSPNFIAVSLAAMALLAWFLGSLAFAFLAVALGAAFVAFAAPDAHKAFQQNEFSDAVTLIGVPAFLFVLMAATFSRFPGFERGAVTFVVHGIAFVVALAALFGFLALQSMPEKRWRLPLDAAARGGALLCAAMAVAQFHARLYDSSLAPLWKHALPGPFMPTAVQSAGMAIATGGAAVLAMFGPNLPVEVRMPLRDTARNVAIIVGCFFVGLLVVVALSPGYVYSGYMSRYLNLLVLPFALSIGFVLYATVAIGRRLIDNSAFGQIGTQVVTARLYLVLPVMLTGWWIAIQAADAHLFPADNLTVVNALRALNPYRPTIVANSYPAPFAIATGKWAFLDETFSSGRIETPPASDYRYSFDKKYLWFADRATNREYEKPDVFVCLITPTYRSAALRLTRSPALAGCSGNRVIQFADQNAGRAWPHHTILSRDQSGRDSWAIVLLDWKFPPYLEPKSKVTLQGENLTVNYNYRQQDGQAERLTEIELWPVSRNGATCFLRGAPLAVTKGFGGIGTLALPQPGFAVDLVVLARPQTATRTGAPFFSLPFNIEKGASIAASPPCNAIRDVDGRNWPQRAGG